VNKLFGEARDEPVHLPAADLLIDGSARVIGILGRCELRARQVMDGIVDAPVAVLELGLQPVDVGATGEREVAEHVVEGAVLEHQDDDVLDLVQVARGFGHRLLLAGRLVGGTRHRVSRGRQ
jgi:hypothetical protein